MKYDMEKYLKGIEILQTQNQSIVKEIEKYKNEDKNMIGILNRRIKIKNN
jgi:hypothetical protein